MDDKGGKTDNVSTINVIKRPISTEKAVRLMESENKLVFAVSRKARRAEIKKAVEEMFKIKVVKVNIVVTPRGEKRAFVKLSPDTPALDVGTKLGMM